MKKEHRNKMIAPIIIAAVLIVYYVAIAAVFMLIPDLTVIMKLLMVIIPLALAGVAFAVTVERVQEIRSEKKMILVNTDYISGKNLEMLGLVKGSTIQSKNIGKDITQSFKTLVGGELKAYNEMMNEARALATKRMVEEAESLGADAVVNIRYASSAVMQGAAEVIAYGTAVKFTN